MSLRDDLINKRDEFILKNNEYNYQLTRIANLRNEIEELKRDKDTKLNKIRCIYWIIASILILFQNIIDLDGIQHIISLCGIQVNAIFLFRGSAKVRNEITNKEKELFSLEEENESLYDLVFDLRSEVHRLADEVENAPVMELEETIQDVIEEVRDYKIGEQEERPVMKMLSLY